jgi:hypothetical protein
MIRLDYLERIKRKYDPDNKYVWTIYDNDGELMLDVSFTGEGGSVSVTMNVSSMYSFKSRFVKKIKKLEELTKVFIQYSE